MSKNFDEPEMFKLFFIKSFNMYSHIFPENLNSYIINTDFTPVVLAG